MREVKHIEQPFVDWVRDDWPLPAVALKLVLFAGSGFPDRTILGSGKIFFIEFKKSGRVLDPAQTKWKKILQRLGFKVYVCTSTAQAIRIFKTVMESS
ncbi:VRR-NUC domain-containing protein [Patescibacteria group bacterium]|nr:VRR-NUC domain-containing protein [Patescibacteria group bacterium]